MAAHTRVVGVDAPSREALAHLRGLPEASRENGVAALTDEPARDCFLEGEHAPRVIAAAARVSSPAAAAALLEPHPDAAALVAFESESTPPAVRAAAALAVDRAALRRRDRDAADPQPEGGRVAGADDRSLAGVDAPAGEGAST